jgi:glycine oxidase
VGCERPDDVVIVGGGVIGLATAHRLAAAGRRVRVVERDRPGAGASTVAAGILSPTDVHEWHGPLGKLNARGLTVWPSYAEELQDAAGGDIGFRGRGSLRLDTGDDASADWLAATETAMAELGVPAERLEAAEAVDRVPGLTGVRGGLLAPSDGAVDTDRLVPALVRAATTAGAEIEHDAVVDLDRDGDRVTGVVLASGRTRSAGTVIVAGGAWTGVADWLPATCRPALRPVAGEAVLADGADGSIDLVVRTREGSLTPRADGRMWLGTTVRDVGFVDRPNLGAVAGLLARLLRILPGLADLDLADVRVGLRPVSTDGLPHVGPTPLEGLAVATGHGREGILHAPLAAAALAGLVLDGELPPWAQAAAPRIAGG